jgi:hypothetical protein
MIKASKFVIAIAAVASLAMATMKGSSAAPVTIGANGAAPLATSEVVYRGYFGDDYGPYAYRPAYTYQGYTYWRSSARSRKSFGATGAGRRTPTASRSSGLVRASPRRVP